MRAAVGKEAVVAGYVNQHNNGEFLSADAIYAYLPSLRNAGCGPIRLDFTREDIERFLNQCVGICLSRVPGGYVIDKSTILNGISIGDHKGLLFMDRRQAESYALFHKLKVDERTPDGVKDVMGFEFF